MVLRSNTTLRLALAGWTLFVWGTRISNILSDGGGLGALFVAVALTALGVGVFVGTVSKSLPWAPAVLAGATVVVWLARVPSILLGGHSVAFVVVHLVLAAVSFGLAFVVALRAVSPRPRSRVSRRRPPSVPA